MEPVIAVVAALFVGLPLVIGLGALLAMGLLGLEPALALVLGCLLAPTDAALGQPLMTDERVPLRLRQAINVESGLNDGLVVPFLSVALVLGAVFVEFVAAALSLTVVRMLPIALSLLGLGLRRDTVGMLGWFGPRGLATVVFALEVLELDQSGVLEQGDRLFGVAALVVVASVLLHGLSARPLASRYVRRLPPAAGRRRRAAARVGRCGGPAHAAGSAGALKRLVPSGQCPSWGLDAA